MNTAQHRVPIIAVFGSNKANTLELAQSIGGEIARQNCILLTGGTSSSGKAVKEKAIAGAEEARREDFVAPWIGVARDKNRQDSDPAADGRSFVIHPGFDHKRNYIEACFCDAAIALEGGEGTVSEVTFCLSLQKPVVLVGNNWAKDYPLASSEKDKTLDKLVKEAFNRVGRERSRNSTLDQLLTEKTIRDNLTKSLPAYKYSPIPPNPNWPNEATQIVKCVYDFLKYSGLKGAFPSLAGKEYQNMKAKYDSWLGKIEKLLTTSARLPGSQS